MKEISQKQYEAAYKVGLRRHDEKLKMADVRRLLSDTGMEESSASILAGNVSYMLKGEVYKRAQSIPATDDFLTWVRRDRGDAALENALRSVRAHIEYYQSGHKGVRVGLWKVLTKHEGLLGQPITSSLFLEYKDMFARGFVDVLPLDLFAEEKTLRGIEHRVRSRGGKEYRAQCDVNVRGMVATLDYEEYHEFNTAQGMLLGIARLTFSDQDRTEIAQVEWKPEKSDAFKQCEFETPRFLVPPSRPYVPPSKTADKILRPVRERPGQAAFRRTLKYVYGNCCCITGCCVAEVLEGAHIDPYLGPDSDHVCNGLLLRSDIHALFDKHLIGIEPASLTVHVSNLARGESGYESLHGMPLKCPENSYHHPDPDALGRHWERFLKSI